jgi:hypothetical protein
MRDELQQVVIDAINDSEGNSEKITDAILAALPDMVQPLVDALKPFAEYMHTEDGRMDLDNEGNEVPDDQCVGWIYLTHGDFRKARAKCLAALGLAPQGEQG